MDWHQQIDGYCERIDPSFWAEPWNAVTNAAFIIAAVLCLMAAVRRGRMDGPVIWLIALTAIIGIGSFLFHTYATAWAAVADVAPIGLFILTYFTISMVCFARYGWGKALLLTVGYVVVLTGLSWVTNTLLRDIVGGSVSYFPAMIAIFAVGAWLHARSHPAGMWLIAAGVTFVASLTFRAIDLPLCDGFHLGTHWMWHNLNGVVLGLLTYAVIRHGARQTA
ncbi:MAG: ceramidase domain-containing protein [Pseudomonadota bacterium]